MKIQEVSNINFSSNAVKKRFVDENTRANVEKLLWNMNNQTIYKENSEKTTFLSNILASVSLDKKHKFIDNRMLIAPTDAVPKGAYDCTVRLGNNILNINSTTGEIVSAEKGFFKTWNNLIQETGYFIKILLENFNDPKVVTKNRFSIKGYTKKGFEILKKYIR